MMNNNTNSLIGNQFSEQELQNGSLNGSCEDYNGSTGVWRISENEKLHEILHNQRSEQRYVYTVQKIQRLSESGGSTFRRCPVPLRFSPLCQRQYVFL